MARLAIPKNSIECQCGVVIREKDMISESYRNAEYLVCPQCKDAHWLFTPNTDDKTQKPIITKERMGRNDASQILLKIRRRSKEVKEFDG